MSDTSDNSPYLTRESHLVRLMCGGGCYWPKCDNKKCGGERLYSMIHVLVNHGAINPNWKPTP